jgi:transcriptional activator SPT7
MASRGRKAPAKTAKKGASSARKAPPAINEGTPVPESKPNGASQPLRNNFLHPDSDIMMDGIINGFSTPPPPGGNLTPIGINGVIPSGASQTDASDADGPGFSVGDMTQADEPEYADLDFRTWKQVTKHARAVAAAERNRLFINGRLNPEEPAILRSKAGMRRFARLQKKFLLTEGATEDSSASDSKDESAPAIAGETLAEGVEAAEDDYILPDYYDPVSAIPEVNERLRWEEDNEGEVIVHADECLRIVPPGYFRSPESILQKKISSNMKQMQDTRKICAKIAVVKQMQLQTQVYQNQFQKYEPAPFYEHDIETHVVSDDGPIMSPEVCRAAFQRSVAKVLYHAGFEDYQPTALDALTDCMGEFFQRLISTFMSYASTPKVPSGGDVSRQVVQPKYTLEEALIHTLEQNSIDVESLDTYVKDDMDRLSGKLGVMHERMKAHLADLLVMFLFSKWREHLLTKFSVLLWTLLLVLTVSVPLMMAASNSLAATSLWTLTKISSASAS